MRQIIYPEPKSQHFLNRYIKFINSINNPDNAIVEVHHILPKSMGGKNNSDNLIKLTPRQHYIAHWMLWKAFETKETTAAFFSMCNQTNQHQSRNFRISSSMYESLKIEFKRHIKGIAEELWSDPVYRKKHQDSNASEHTKKLRSEKAKELWQNPDYREKLTESRKAAWAEGRVNRDHSKCGTKGEKNPAKRPDVKAKNSGPNHYSNREGYVKPICPHCGIQSTPTNITRWHGDNCKKKI